MKYPKCSNSSCTHNDTYRCKADGLEEDIICKIGKSDFSRKVKTERDRFSEQVHISLKEL